MSRMTVEEKAEAILRLGYHDTFEVEVMEDFKYGRDESGLLKEAEAEQADPPDSRTVTVALQRLVKRMLEDGNLDNLEGVPVYLRPTEVTA